MAFRSQQIYNRTVKQICSPAVYVHSHSNSTMWLLSDQPQSVKRLCFCLATLKSARLHQNCVVSLLSAAVSSLQLPCRPGGWGRGVTSVLPHCRCVVFVCRVKLTVFTAASAAGEAARCWTNLRFLLLLTFRQPQLPPLSQKNNHLLKQFII